MNIPFIFFGYSFVSFNSFILLLWCFLFFLFRGLLFRFFIFIFWILCFLLFILLILLTSVFILIFFVFIVFFILFLLNKNLRFFNFLHVAYNLISFKFDFDFLQRDNFKRINDQSNRNLKVSLINFFNPINFISSEELKSIFILFVQLENNIAIALEIEFLSESKPALLIEYSNILKKVPLVPLLHPIIKIPQHRPDFKIEPIIKSGSLNLELLRRISSIESSP